MSAIEISEPLFRPLKRRKFLRKRPDDQLEDPEPSVPQSGSSQLEQTSKIQPAGEAASPTNEDHAQDAIIAETLRRRKTHKVRRGGIEFSTGSRQMSDGGHESPLSGAFTVQDMEDDRLRAISDRFIPHTGQRVDVDKHMYILLRCSWVNALKFMETNEIRMAYIESEMAKRHHRSQPQEKSASCHSAVGEI